MQLFSVSDQHLEKRKTNGRGNRGRAVPTGHPGRGGGVLVLAASWGDSGKGVSLS